MKTILIVGAATAGGVVAGKMIFAQVTKLETVAGLESGTKDAISIGVQAATAALIFSLVTR